MKLYQFENAEQIMDYQSRVLSRTGNSGKKKVYLSHYTNIEGVTNILNSGHLYLSSGMRMNDPIEANYISQHGLDNKLFYFCLSKAHENLALYKMYQKNVEDGVIMQFTYSNIEEIIKHNAPEKDKSNKYLSSHGSVPLVRYDKLTEETIESTIYCVEVLYYSHSNNVIMSSNERHRNYKLDFPLKKEELVGSLKFDCWKYENEIRLCGRTPERLSDIEKIALSIPESIYRNIRVILGPGFDEEKNRKHLLILRESGIDIQSSYYRGEYGSVLR